MNTSPESRIATASEIKPGDRVLFQLNKVITVHTSFRALHIWPDAPQEVAFLGFPHLHTFNVRVTVSPGGKDRGVEFFIFRNEIDIAIRNLFFADNTPHVYSSAMPGFNLGLPTIAKSCEDIAILIGKVLLDAGYRVLNIAVDEDGDNAGAFFATTVEPNSVEDHG